MNSTLKNLSLMLLLAAGSSLNAQTAGPATGAAGREVVYVKGLRFVDALLEKWIAEYSKAHPGVSLSVAGKDAEAYPIRILPQGKAADDAPETASISFGKYAILPIAGKNNTLPDELKRKKLNGKRLRELFFEKDLLSDSDEPDKKDRYRATVYAGSGAYSVSHSFAGHFGYEAGSLKGKKIAGDDVYLNSAVEKDAQGVSFNSLNYIFDLKSRRLNEGLALLPLDVKKEHAEALSRENLDETITVLEDNEVDLIPVEELAFVLPEKVSPAMFRFLEWTLSEGQHYLHSYGFLRLDSKTLSRQQKQVLALETKLLANK
jgi:hypothetical protein